MLHSDFITSAIYTSLLEMNIYAIKENEINGKSWQNEHGTDNSTLCVKKKKKQNTLRLIETQRQLKQCK